MSKANTPHPLSRTNSLMSWVGYFIYERLPGGCQGHTPVPEAVLTCTFPRVLMAGGIGA